MKKFIGDSLVWLSILFGVLTVSWCWSWNWFLAIIFGLFVFVFLCNLGATLSPPEQQNEVKQINVELESVLYKIDGITQSMSSNYIKLDSLNYELKHIMELKPRSVEMKTKIAKEIICKAEEIEQLMELIDVNMNEVKTLLISNREDIVKINSELVANLDCLIREHDKVINTTSKLQVQDIIYYYKEFLN